MNRHDLVWPNLAFGIVFLAIAGGWIGWTQDALSTEQFAVAAPIFLIVMGLAGIAASLWRRP